MAYSHPLDASSGSKGGGNACSLGDQDALRCVPLVHEGTSDSDQGFGFFGFGVGVRVTAL